MSDWTKPLFIASTTLCAFTSGLGMCFSVAGMPGGTNVPDKNSRVIAFRNMLKLGTLTVPPMAVVSGLLNFATAYSTYNAQAPQRAYRFIGAGLVTISIIPYTMAFMLSINNELSRRATRIDQGLPPTDAAENTETKVAKKSSEALIQDWISFNYFRALLPFTGSILAFQAL